MQGIGTGLPSLSSWNAAAFSSRRREGRSHPSKRGAAPDTVALGDQIQTGTRRPRTAARVVPPLLVLDEHDRPFNNGGCFKHRPDQQHRASSPRRCALWASRFLFRYRDARPAGMTSSSVRPGLILRAKTVARGGSPERRCVLR